MAGKKMADRKRTVRKRWENPSAILNPFRNKRSAVLTYNPANENRGRPEATQSTIELYNYNKASCEEKHFEGIEDIQTLLSQIDNEKLSWLNIVGLRTKEVQNICLHFGIHRLTIEDILSDGQRAKMDEVANGIFCLLPILFYNEALGEIEREQVSLILTKNTVLSFQNVQQREIFERVKIKLRTRDSRIREKRSDFLYYSLLDAIVDDYFTSIEKTGLQIEDMEEVIIRNANNKTLLTLNDFRRKTGSLRRAIAPVRDLVGGILKSENNLIDQKTRQYFKDIYDHIVQANETADSYRDLIMNLQGLYINQVSLKMNEVMKVLAVVTALFAPLTLIAGIYGMNFENMPELHTHYGYFITLGVMAVLFFLMLYIFKKRGWF